jgi:hypothetical protein
MAMALVQWIAIVPMSLLDAGLCSELSLAAVRFGALTLVTSTTRGLLTGS